MISALQRSVAAELSHVVPFPADIDWRNAVTLRRNVHRYAGQGADVQESFDFIEQWLKADDLKFDYAGNSLFALLRGRRPARGDLPPILLRADIDALPLLEPVSEIDYRSVHDGIMHACGHDLHSTALALAARYLARTRNFEGDVLLCWQSQEETARGARDVLASGILQRFGIKRAMTVHAKPEHLYWQMGARTGPVCAGAENFSARIGYTPAAAQHLDPFLPTLPINLAALLIRDGPSLIPHTVNALQAAVHVPTQFHAGRDGDDVNIRITLRGPNTAHGGRPHLAPNPVNTAARLIGDCATLYANPMDMAKAASVIPVYVDAGSADNIITDTASLGFHVQARSVRSATSLRDRFVNMVETYARRDGLEATVWFTDDLPSYVDKTSQMAALLGMHESHGRDEAKFSGRIRSLDPDVLHDLVTNYDAMIHDYARLNGLSVELVLESICPSLINDKIQTERYVQMLDLTNKSHGVERIETPESLGSEDFAEYCELADLTLTRCGTANDVDPRTRNPIHTEGFFPDERSIWTMAWAHIVGAHSNAVFAS